MSPNPIRRLRIFEYEYRTSIMQNKLILSCLLASTFTAHASASSQPNIVVILTDDQGYADFSFNQHHPKEVSTPHMDTLAREGIFFSQAYLSGNVCSPTRAGLMLGQYQHRVGVYDAGTGGSGFDPTIPIFPSFLPDTYFAGAFGKWHLGLDDDYPALKWHPLSRGFDSFYGFMGRGAHDYFNLRSDTDGKFMHPVYRDKQRIHDKGYLTTRLSEEAVEFVHKRHEKPFFLYLAYNAVHTPAQAPAEDIKRYHAKYPHLSETRVILMAMLEHLDNGIGDVVKALKETDSFDDTLLFFFTDNGGAGAMEANNAPLRGFKQQVYEGGHRTPFVVSWPARFKGGRVIDTPIISLDVLPTVLDALGQLKPENSFDAACDRRKQQAPPPQPLLVRRRRHRGVGSPIRRLQTSGLQKCARTLQPCRRPRGIQ
ncbi:MAG TPA: N-acetylgalactosamine 6-sulfatase (GALNS) [Fuerstia sp.]|nr:N-acetylgalactosamine 6-sulfatase (GALNS) [Fuerstiella sp.]